MLSRLRLTRSVTVRLLTTSSRPADHDLRRAFDHAEFGRELVHGSTESSGLFDNVQLSSPHGLTQFAQDSLQKAKALATDVITNSSHESLRNKIRNLDILSDTLCKVIDMAAFVRMSHPNERFLEAAQGAHEMLFEYMNVLNTSVEMYQMLERVLSDKTLLESLSDEEIQVGKILLADFQRSGVQLNPETRAKFIEISNNVSILGQQFLTEAAPVKDYISFSAANVDGLDPQLVQQLKTRFGGKVRVPTSGAVSNLALRTMHSEKSRKKLWVAQRAASDEQEHVLKGFLQQRAALADMMGCESFAAYELQGKMMHTPENVTQFLDQIKAKSFPMAKQELNSLVELKGQGHQLNPWDRDYYSAKLMQSRRRSKTLTKSSAMLSSYFSLGTVMQGLSRLFTSIYGIKFVPRETKQGEVWNDQVRRLDVVCEREGLIGVMYCDLYERQGKSPNPAHFTVQCSRQVYPDEHEFQNQDLREIGGKKYQLPIIALVCDFAPSVNNSEQCLLTFPEVETLFHEMGHAIHSMLGRTNLHNVSGTRCASDFVELPSVIMERFAADPKVLALFARHYQTDEPLPYELVQAHLTNQAAFKHCENYNQIHLSILDQQLHSTRALADGDKFSPEQIYHDLESKHALMAQQEQSRWHLFFGHLFGYGATYYCYLFDRAIADRIWHQVFAKDPTSRVAGECFRSEVLSWGGARDPWKCVSGVLKDDSLAKGDKQAILSIANSMDL